MHAGSSSNCMGVYEKGLGAAFATQMKLWHLGRQEWCPAQAGADWTDAAFNLCRHSSIHITSAFLFGMARASRTGLDFNNVWVMSCLCMSAAVLHGDWQ